MPVGTIAGNSLLYVAASTTSTQFSSLMSTRKRRTNSVARIYSSSTGAQGFIREDASSDVAATISTSTQKVFRVVKTAASIDGSTYDFHYSIEDRP